MNVVLYLFIINHLNKLSMKKCFLLVGVAVAMMTSCSTVQKSAKTQDVPITIQTATAADLDIAPERVSLTLTVDRPLRKGGGLKNVMNAATQSLLEQNGNADVLIDPMYVVKRSGLLHKIRTIKVSGRPAKYKNFRNVE